MTDIIRVWGTCDNIKIEFNYEGGKMWSCKVPPDFKDGIYVAEFWAQDNKGRIGHWTGFLYMSSGVCHFKFKKEKYQIWLNPQKYKIEIKNSENYNFNLDIKNRWTWEFFKQDIKPTTLYIKPYKYFFDIKDSKEKYKLFFSKEKYQIEIKASDFFEKPNRIQTRLENRKTKLLLKVNQLSARLDKAILDFMLLDYDDTNEEENKKSRYQIRIKTDKSKIEIVKSKYVIFVEKRCKHW